MFTKLSVNVVSGLVLQGSPNLVHDATSWQCEHEWRQDIAVVTKWLAGASPVSNLNLYLFDILLFARHVCAFTSPLYDYRIGCM